MEDISAGHSPNNVPNMREAAVSEGTPCALHPATTTVCAIFDQ